MGRLIAIDYGQKRVGIAVTDEHRLIATGLTTVAAKDVMSFLKDYLAKEKVDKFIVGEPRQMNNSPSESVAFIRPFVRQLRKEFPTIPVVSVDERFTSKIAERTVAASGLKKKDRRNKELIDRISATLILQSYMESGS
jgi:putative Holliday junction resolvase